MSEFTFVVLFTGTGVMIMFASSIVLLVKAFQASVLWSLAFLFIPFASLVFVVTHWGESEKPFLVLLLGVAFILAGVIFPEFYDISS